MSSTTLDIEGMTCQHCVMAVTRALQGVAGVQSATVQLDPGRAEVTGEAAPAALLQAVQKQGYQARVHGA